MLDLFHSKNHYNKEEFNDVFKEVATGLLESGSKLLNKNRTNDAYLIFSKIEELTSPGHYNSFPDIRALTYNYIGCYFRNKEFFKLALDHFEKAIKYLEMTGTISKRAVTYLNICGVMSQIGAYR